MAFRNNHFQDDQCGGDDEGERKEKCNFQITFKNAQ